MPGLAAAAVVPGALPAYAAAAAAPAAASLPFTAPVPSSMVAGGFNPNYQHQPGSAYALQAAAAGPLQAAAAATAAHAQPPTASAAAAGSFGLPPTAAEVQAEPNYSALADLTLAQLLAAAAADKAAARPYTPGRQGGDMQLQLPPQLQLDIGTDSVTVHKAMPRHVH